MPLTAAQKTQVVDLRQRGQKIAAIAATLGVGKAQVENFLNYKGIRLGDEQRSAAYRQVSEALLAELRYLRQAGKTGSQIAEALGITLDRVQYLCRFYAIPCFTKPGQRARKYSDADRQRLVELRAANPDWTYQQIADASGTGITWGQVANILRAMGCARSASQGHAARRRAQRKTLIETRETIADFPALVAEWHPTKNVGRQPGDVCYGSREPAWWVCSRGHEWDTPPNARTASGRGDGCPHCCGRISRGQREVAETIRSWLPTENVELEPRNFLGRPKVDILIRGRRLAIEYHGLWWHSAAAPNFARGRDVKKLAMIHDKGYQAFFIFEDDWRDRRLIVESMLRQRLGITSRTVYARKTVVRPISATEARDFLRENHLDGSTAASIHLGLFLGDELLGVATVRKKTGGIHELARLAFLLNVRVTGGVGKLLASLPRPIFTYSNNRFSVGAAYVAAGFKEVTETREPGYFYTDGVHRFGRLSCRKIHEPQVLAVAATEEEQCRQGFQAERLLGKKKPLFRIEDCGHRKWLLT